VKAVIKVGPTGLGSIEVDGIDLSKVVMGIDFVASPGKLPSLVLTLIPAEVEIEADFDEIHKVLSELHWVTDYDTEPEPPEDEQEPPAVPSLYSEASRIAGASLVGMYVQGLYGKSLGVIGKVFWHGPNRYGPGEAVGFKQDGEDQAYWAGVDQVIPLK